MKSFSPLLVLAAVSTLAHAQLNGRLPVNDLQVVEPDPNAPLRVTQDPLPQTDEGLPKGVITRTKIVNRTNYVPIATYPTPTPEPAPETTAPSAPVSAVATTLVETAPASVPTPPPAPQPRFASPTVRPRGESATGWNVAAYAGANLQQSADIRVNLFKAISTDYQEKSQTSLAVGGKIGYTYPFESFGFNKRLSGIKFTTGIEADISYLQSDLKGRLADAPSDALTGASGSPLLSAYTPLNAALNIDSAVFMLNWLGKMQIGESFRPYIGAGVGVNYTTVSSSQLAAIGNTLGTATLGGTVYPSRKVTNLGLAYQVLAGGEWFLARDWAFFGEYKYVVFDSVNTLQFPIETKIGSLGNHVAIFGLRTYF